MSRKTTATLAALVLGALLWVPAPAQAASSLGARIGRTAYGMAHYTARNRERGTNCNFFSGALRAGPTCGNGWRQAPWCADFARWTWMRSGAATGGLDAWANSFRTYGQRHGTWHPGAALGGVHVGDVIGWRFGGTLDDDHVGVVIAVRRYSVLTVDGNVNNRITVRSIARNTSGVSGYTRPVRR